MTRALLTLHMQVGVVDGCGPQGDAAVERLQAAITSCRRHDLPVIHVRMVFRRGLVDVAPGSRTSPFLARFEVGAPDTALHPGIASLAADIDVVGKRASAFKGSDLRVVLAALGARDLVVAGIGTSGVVLATVLEAADLDYRVTVLSDACADPDQQLHDVLCTRVLPVRAEVQTVADWITAVDGP